jgi:outer membrane protein assembly factor BamB
VKKQLSLGALALSLLLVVGGGCTIGRKGFDWPARRGPGGNGISKETGWNPKALAGGPKILWQANIGNGYANVAIRDNLLVTMGTKEGFTTIYGLKADTGKEIWKYSYANTNDTQATPAIDGNSVYALSLEGELFCLNSRNGKLRWKKELVKDHGALRPVWGFAGSPIIVEDLVILTANSSGMGLNKKNGEKVWVSDRPPKQFKASDPHASNGADYATPVVFKRHEKTYALIASWKGLSAVDVQTGRPLWVYEWELYSGCHTTDPVVDGDHIYLAENYHPPSKPRPGSLFLDVSGESPALLWKSSELTTEISDAVALDGYLYSGQGGPRFFGASLRCIDLKTGTLKWEKAVSEAAMPNCVTLSAAGGKLIVLTDDGVLAVAESSAESYQEISRCILLPEVTKKFWSPPVLCNGRIYCRNYHGELVCVDVSK